MVASNEGYTEVINLLKAHGSSSMIQIISFKNTYDLCIL